MASEYIPAKERSRPRRDRRRRDHGTIGRVFFLLGASLAAFLLLATLFGQIRLTALNDEAVAAAASVEQRRREQARLLIDHETVYGLSRVDAYARQELGMQPPRGDQLQYLEGSPPDRITLYPETDGFCLLDSIAACFR